MDDSVAAMLARQAISDALGRYCRGVDRMDKAMALSLWHPDGTADYAPWYTGGCTGLIEWMWTAHAPVVAHLHQVHNVFVELDGDNAASEAYYTAVLRFERRDGSPVDRVVRGRYLDRWSARQGVWAVDHRRAMQDIESVTDTRTTGRTDGAARRDTTDPSYELFRARP